MGKKYKGDGDDSADTTLGTDTPADVAAPDSKLSTGSILVSSQILHEREWFGRVYGQRPTLLKIADLQPGELEKLQADTYLTIEPA